MVGTEGGCADDGGGGSGDGGVAFSDDGEDVGAGEVVFELAVFVVLGVGGLAGECVGGGGGGGGVGGDGDGGGGDVRRRGDAVVGAVGGGGAGGLVGGVGSGGGAEVAATNRGCCGGGLVLQRFVCAVV